MVPLTPLPGVASAVEGTTPAATTHAATATALRIRPLRPLRTPLTAIAAPSRPVTPDICDDTSNSAERTSHGGGSADHRNPTPVRQKRYGTTPAPRHTDT